LGSYPSKGVAGEKREKKWKEAGQIIEGPKIERKTNKGEGERKGTLKGVST